MPDDKSAEPAESKDGWFESLYKVVRPKYQAPVIVLGIFCAGVMIAWRTSGNVRSEMEVATEKVERPHLEALKVVDTRQDDTLKDHEERLRTLETGVAGMVADVHSMRDDIHFLRENTGK